MAAGRRIDDDIVVPVNGEPVAVYGWGSAGHRPRRPVAGATADVRLRAPPGARSRLAVSAPAAVGGASRGASPSPAGQETRHFNRRRITMSSTCGLGGAGIASSNNASYLLNRRAKPPTLVPMFVDTAGDDDKSHVGAERVRDRCQRRCRYAAGVAHVQRASAADANLEGPRDRRLQARQPGGGRAPAADARRRQRLRLGRAAARHGAGAAPGPAPAARGSAAVRLGSACGEARPAADSRSALRAGGWGGPGQPAGRSCACCADSRRTPRSS